MVFGEAIWLIVVGAFNRYADAEVMDEAEEEAREGGGRLLVGVAITVVAGSSMTVVGSSSLGSCGLQQQSFRIAHIAMKALRRVIANPMAMSTMMTPHEN